MKSTYLLIQGIHSISKVSEYSCLRKILSHFSPSPSTESLPVEPANRDQGSLRHSTSLYPNLHQIPMPTEQSSKSLKLIFVFLSWFLRSSSLKGLSNSFFNWTLFSWIVCCTPSHLTVYILLSVNPVKTERIYSVNGHTGRERRREGRQRQTYREQEKLL